MQSGVRQTSGGCVSLVASDDELRSIAPPIAGARRRSGVLEGSGSSRSFACPPRPPFGAGSSSGHRSAALGDRIGRSDPGSEASDGAVVGVGAGGGGHWRRAEFAGVGAAGASHGTDADAAAAAAHGANGALLRRHPPIFAGERDASGEFPSRRRRPQFWSALRLAALVRTSAAALTLGATSASQPTATSSHTRVTKGTAHVNLEHIPSTNHGKRRVILHNSDVFATKEE